LNNNNITSLEGIQQFKHLKILSLLGNRVPLSELSKVSATLTELNYKHIGSKQALGMFPKLQTLNGENINT
jgi:hypothetical protein